MKVDIYDEDCVSEEEEVPEFFSGKNLKQIKQYIVKGDFSNEEIEPTLKQLIENYNLSLGNQTGFFFHISTSNIGLASSSHGDPSFTIRNRPYINKRNC